MITIKKTAKKINQVLFKPIRKLKGEILLKNKDFTIISNNCWGGIVYQDYDLEYTTPTVGVYFFAEEYIKFLRNIKGYLDMKLEFIDSAKSKYYQYMQENNLETNVPIGLLGDVEIVFLHYKSNEEAEGKWERRKKRINWNNLIVKFNDQNLCNEELIYEFDSLKFSNKLCFTAKHYEGLKSVVVFDEYSNEQFVLNDTKKSIYKKYIDTTKYINNMTKTY